MCSSRMVREPALTALKTLAKCRVIFSWCTVGNGNLFLMEILSSILNIHSRTQAACSKHTIFDSTSIIKRPYVSRMGSKNIMRFAVKQSNETGTVLTSQFDKLRPSVNVSFEISELKSLLSVSFAPSESSQKAIKASAVVTSVVMVP